MQLSLHTAGLSNHQVMAGSIERPWGLSGFSGFKAGQCEYGVRGDEFMVRVMSNLAQNSWRRLYELSDSVTRLDLQVTVDLKRDCQPVVEKLYRRACRLSLKRKRGPQNRIILGNDGGATLYCGNRNSNRFGRCYAKGPQSKLEFYKTCLRFEVQYNGQLAKRKAASLALAKCERTFAISSSVGFFQNRVGSLPIPIGQVLNDSCPRSRSDCRQKLDWLSASVRPSVKYLLARGLVKEVYSALGLPGDRGPRDE